MCTVYERFSKLDKTKVVSFGIQIKVKDSMGKEKFLSTTYPYDPAVKLEKAKAAAKKFGDKWEQEYRDKHTHTLSTATFKQIANVWLDMRKATLSANSYRNACTCIERMSDFFGKKYFVDLRAFDIQQFFSYLNNYKYEHVTARLKPSKAEKFNTTVLDFGVKKVCRENLFSRPTLYYARKGDKVSLQSAKLICNRYGLNFNDYFETETAGSSYRKESIKKYKSVLSAIYTYCMSIELVDKNYASSYYLKKVIGGKDAKEIRILAMDEYQRFLSELDKHDIFETIPLYLLSMLGLRSCEVCGLEWRDIDLKNHKITIQRDRVYVPKLGIKVNKTKTKYSVRTLHICKLLADKLQQYKKVYEELRKNDKHFSHSGTIFCNLDGTPRFPQYLNHLLKKYLLLANCEPISCHKIRHTWITKLISEGIPPNVVSKMAGHVDTDITLKIYTHYSKSVDNSEEVLERIYAEMAS